MKSAPRRVWIGVFAAIGAAAVLAAVWMHYLSAPDRENREISVLRKRRTALRDSLDAMIDRDPLIHIASNDNSDIAVALSQRVLVALLQEVTVRYLDRVEIDVEDVQGHGKGTFKTGSPFGRLTVGEWTVQVRVHEFGGVLSAGVPTVEVAGNNRLHMAIPTRIREGDGSLTLDFAWNSNSVFNVVCRDFKTTQTLRGRVLPQRHVVRGDFVLSAAGAGIVADPEFPPEKFPLAMALDQASWDRLRAALEEQDKLLKCGLLIKPDVVIARLRDLGARGLKFKLPRSLMRTVVLPASIEKSVRILGSSVELSVRPHELQITPEMFWYSANVDAKKSSEPGEPLPVPGGVK